MVDHANLAPLHGCVPVIQADIPTLESLELQDTVEGAKTSVPIDAAFIAIGHTPNTGFVSGVVDMDKNGYIVLPGKNTRTSVPGIFAAGDVSDHVYRQATVAAWPLRLTPRCNAMVAPTSLALHLHETGTPT